MVRQMIRALAGVPLGAAIGLLVSSTTVEDTNAAANFSVASAPQAQQPERRAPAKEAPTEEQIQIPAGKENLPAEQVFKNIEILKGQPASRLPKMMKALKGLLGVDCTHCHVQDAWEKEEPPAKLTARRMFRMVGNVSQRYFDGKNEITCWTCHRGEPKPPNGAAEIGAAMQEFPSERRQLIARLIDELGQGKDKPAEQVFENLQFFKGMPANRFVRVMGVFTAVLGVDCAHCHVPDRWDEDDRPAKQTARDMLRMVLDINQQLFDGTPKVACWTCHRGAAKPESSPR